VPSAFSHAVAAAAIGACFYRPGVPRRVWVLGAVCATVPDLDVVGFRFGIAYGDMLGHRGLSHSLPFAAMLATLIVGFGFREGALGITRPLGWLH
jgi:inner membrane protein